MGGCLSTNRDQGSGRNRNNRRRRRIPPGERLNKPLKRPIWTHDVEADGPPPSITSLQRERDDFWFTRVTGRPEIWSVIKRVCEMLMTDDSDQQLANAREMLRVAEITLPTGAFDGGAWDKYGNSYRVPRRIVSNPTNVGAASPPRNSIDSWESSESGKSNMSGGRAASELSAVSYIVKFRVQYGNASIDAQIQVWSDEKLKKAAKRLLTELEIAPEDHRAYVVMDGRPFDLKKKLMDPGQPPWLANRIIQAFVRPIIDPESSPSPPGPMDKPLLVPFPAPPNTQYAQPEVGTSQRSEENQGPGPSRRARSSDSKASAESQTPTLISNSISV